MVTNVDLSTDSGGATFWNYHPRDWSDEFKFLKNIRYCGDAGDLWAYRIYGEVVPDATEWKEVVENYLNDQGLDHVLYNIHGFSVAPEASFHHGHDFNDSERSGYLVIPINWRNLWGSTAASYEIDRNSYAVPGGRDLSKAFPYFSGAPYSTSIMVHSMGNYVFRHFAQSLENPEQVFQNVFMVAADARSDMFSTEYNPDAPKDDEAGRSSEEPNALDKHVYLELPEDEELPNGGYAITRLTVHTHVVWNINDDALRAREAFQIPCVLCWPGSEEDVRMALGKFGNHAKERTTLKYFNDRVTYHDFSNIITETWAIGDLAHSYQWTPPAVNLYIGYKFQKGSAFPTKVENGGDCTSDADCGSNHCLNSNLKCGYGPPADTSISTKRGLHVN